MNARTALAKWLGTLDSKRLIALLEERRLPLAAECRRITTLRELAGHLLTDESVGHGLMAGTTGELSLLASIATLALERHGPVDDGEAEDVPRYPWQQLRPVEPVEPADRLVAERDVLAWFEPGAERQRAEHTLARLRERALLLPAPRGKLALPPLLHVRAAGLDGYGRTADRLLTAAYNAPEVKRIAVNLFGEGAARTRDQAQGLITTLLADPAGVRALLVDAPPRVLELLDNLASGPPLLRTRCFVSRYGEQYAGPASTYVFREGGSGDEGTDWLAARGLVVPVGLDLAELPYEVARALRHEGVTPGPRLEPEPLTATVLLPPGWEGEGGTAAAAAAWRAELVLRALAAQPVAIRKAGGIAVRDTRRLAKEAGADEAATRLWLDLAVNAGLAAPQDEEPAPAARGRRNAKAPKPSARLLPSDRYDAWAAAPPAGKLLPLLAAWAVVPEILSHWPDPEETPVALTSPRDEDAVTLRTGVLRALATLPDGHGLTGDMPGRVELVVLAAWFQPALRGQLAGDAQGELAAAEELLDRSAATLAEAALLGVVAHGALTPVGRALCHLLAAGAAHHYPAVPGAHADPSARGPEGLGQDLTLRPALARAVTALREALYAALPEPGTTARFQSDLTATVTGAPAPALADLLRAVGDIESEGHAVVWRITTTSVRRALDEGWTADELLDRLTAASERGTPLPQPLAYTIKDAARTHGQLKVVRSACCIRSDDTALIAEVAQARALTKLQLRRIAPTVLISTAPPEETLSALRTAGYAPTQEAETGTTLLDRAPTDRAPSLLPPLDQAHPPYGTSAPGVPSSARTLAAALTAAG
ncbi:helicase-associated domain-containing protein [Streptomyces sp. NBC_00536]|uniref:helicase-associated domain-containing protein n=1 Tax=Streptomyces sp. NBC_00536 TaxID=2975769 RepID=UPI002E801336|nr:helicase-associated domain-containing protein [Streptomyces sp. NBC_00536]WUC81286.1 helicase-associated domain-containing protein [Streptomyces sp. NBC_00536]